MAHALRARKTLSPRFTDFFTDFEQKKPTVLQSKYCWEAITTPGDFDSHSMLGVCGASVLARVVYKRMQQLPPMLRPAVHHGKGTTHKNLETMCNVFAWPQLCWKSCANGSKIVAL